MIYASFKQVLIFRDYKAFCAAMDIPMGAGSERIRTPAEARTARQFLLAINTGKKGVFVNCNKDLAVFVPAAPQVASEQDPGFYESRTLDSSDVAERPISPGQPMYSPREIAAMGRALRKKLDSI